VTRRVTLERTGGVGGLRLRKSVRSEDLPPDTRAAIDRALEDHSAAPAFESHGGPRAPDRFCYTLTVEDGSSRKTISFREGEEPDALRPVLTALARMPEDPDRA